MPDMKMPTLKTSVFLIFFLFFFVACQTVSEQRVSARPPLMAPPDHKFSAFNIEFADTGSKEGQYLIRQLDSFYRIQVNGGFNGSVLVGFKGKILYERYFGYCDKKNNTLLCAQNPTQLASTSKPFTATAILWLYQNKYLNIDDPVKKYLKDFPYPGITITMLLNQRSGLPDYTKMGNKYWKSKDPMYNEDLLQILKTHQPRLNFTPNTRFDYSNTNYAMLARVLEEVTAMSYKRFMKEFIFEPLGMKSTFVYDPADRDLYSSTLTTSYKYNWTVHEETNEDGIYGDKGIYSTVEDMYRWDQSFYKHVLLNEKTLKMAYKGYSYEKAGNKNYGLGWRMMNLPDGYKVIYHNGWWHGNNTVFYRFVDDNFTIIVLGNKYNSKIYSQSKAIYDIVKKTNGQTGNGNVDWEETGSPKGE